MKGVEKRIDWREIELTRMHDFEKYNKTLESLMNLGVLSKDEKGNFKVYEKESRCSGGIRVRPGVCGDSPFYFTNRADAEAYMKVAGEFYGCPGFYCKRVK